MMTRYARSWNVDAVRATHEPGCTFHRWSTYRRQSFSGQASKRVGTSTFQFIVLCTNSFSRVPISVCVSVAPVAGKRYFDLFKARLRWSTLSSWSHCRKSFVCLPSPSGNQSRDRHTSEKSISKSTLTHARIPIPSHHSCESRNRIWRSNVQASNHPSIRRTT